MKKVRIYVLVIMAAVAFPSLVQRHALALNGHAESSRSATEVVQDPALKIVSPEPDQKIAQSSVLVEYKQGSATSSSVKAYELRLDDHKKVWTRDSSYTFDGLTAGSHKLLVQAVDAKNHPISGMRSEINFEVIDAITASSSPAVFSTPTAPPLPSSNDLPGGSSSLPLLSVIGFGILVGGVISALRTRPAHK